MVEAEGDVVVSNDPFQGGTHLPDITLVKPVFGDDAEPIAFLAVRAHHADVGGIAPGSMPLAREIFQEGLRIPPVRIVRGGEREEEKTAHLLATADRFDHPRIPSSQHPLTILVSVSDERRRAAGGSVGVSDSAGRAVAGCAGGRGADA